MKTTGKKNAAGGWLLGEAIWRVTSAAMLSMAVVGFALGFMVRGLPLFDGLAGDGASWALLGAMVLVLGRLYAYWLRVDATWVRGMMAERQVGDLIDHAVAPRGCAFAHDVKEALGGRGNVDHVVMTPAGVWVVETKAAWLSERRFPPVLRQAAENAERVRRHLETTLPVRAALVIADRAQDELESDHDWEGKPVKVFGSKRFWSVLRTECAQAGADGPPLETATVARRVWNLGSTRYLDT